jgi:hypothetical protein
VNEFRSLEQKKLRKLLNLTNGQNGQLPRVLFVEAVVITGKIVSCFTQAWRATGKSLDVVHLFGLFRGASSSQMSNKTNNLKTGYGTCGRSDVAIVEQIVLPNWGKDSCPWCRELSIIQRIERLGTSSPHAKGHFSWRRKLLEDHSGRTDRILHGSNRHSDRKSFDRTSGSKFFDTSKTQNYADACWMLSVASFFQRWRTEPDESNNYVIDPETVVDENKFSDPFLRAAIFRALRSNEITHQNGPDRGRFIEFIKSDTSYKSKKSRNYHLGNEAALAFGEMFQSLELSCYLDEIAEMLCKTKLGRE